MFWGGSAPEMRLRQKPHSLEAGLAVGALIDVPAYLVADLLIQLARSISIGQLGHSGACDAGKGVLLGAAEPWPKEPCGKPEHDDGQSRRQ